MLRGCLLSLGLYGVLTVGYFLWFDSVFEPPATYLGAGVVGLLVLCSIGALMNARTALRDWSLVAAARHSLPPRDGEMIGVVGTIHPLGEPLRAPFSGAECVVCEYDLAGPSRVSQAQDRSNSGSDYAGFLMTPSAIRSPLGDMRLLGFPILEGFEDLPCHGGAAIRNAREYLRSTAFEDRAGLKLVTVLSVFSDVWSDEDGLVQKNLKLSGADPDTILPLGHGDGLDVQRPGDSEDREPDVNAGDVNETGEDEAASDPDGDLNGERGFDDEGEDDEQYPDERNWTRAVPRMTEKRVGVGEPVCAVGIYDEMRRGLLPPPGGLTPNRLLRGSPDQIEHKSRSSFFRNAVGGLLALVVIHAAVYGLMQAYLRSPEGRRRHDPQQVQAVDKSDRSQDSHGLMVS